MIPFYYGIRELKSFHFNSKNIKSELVEEMLFQKRDTKVNTFLELKYFLKKNLKIYSGRFEMIRKS